MAYKKKKLSKQNRQKLKAIAMVVCAVVLGVLIGVGGTRLMSHQKPAMNLIWPADNTVKVPPDLFKFLETQNSCEHYRGNDSPTGIGLWGVYQISQNKFAKIAYGCSWSLTPYIMAIKQSNHWQLIQPADYFAPFKGSIDSRGGALPFCSVVQKYKVPKDIESFCVQIDGTAIANQL